MENKFNINDIVDIDFQNTKSLKSVTIKSVGYDEHGFTYAVEVPVGSDYDATIINNIEERLISLSK